MKESSRNTNTELKLQTPISSLYFSLFGNLRQRGKHFDLLSVSWGRKVSEAVIVEIILWFTPLTPL